MAYAITGTIPGEPASKANSRQLVTIHGRPAFIKSAKARAYEHAALFPFLIEQWPLAERMGNDAVEKDCSDLTFAINRGCKGLNHHGEPSIEDAATESHRP